MTHSDQSATISATAVCVCGHDRQHHVYCNEMYPTLCVEPVDSEPPEWPCCPCMEFRPEEED